MLADLWVVLTVLAFFGLCVAFVKRLRPHHRTRRRRGLLRRRVAGVAGDGRSRGGGTVTGENIAGLVLAALLSLYLIAALLFPEKF